MRVIVAICLLSMALTPVMAEGKSPLTGDTLTASELAAYKAMTAADGAAAQVKDLRVFSMTPWKAAKQPGLFIVATGSEADSFDVAVLKANGNGWEVVAQTNADNSPVVDQYFMLGDLAIDTIPYTISKDEIAFGVRVRAEYTSTSTSVSGTTFHLFRLHDQQLEDILTADTGSSECDKTANDAGCGKETKSILQFAPTRHSGFYDILLKPAKGSKGKIRHYAWKDGAYADSDAKSEDTPNSQ